jgi:hypothetical protein
VDLVGTMSMAGKRAGYLMSLVPPQSYFDASTSGFDLSLRHAYPDWHPDFKYRGRNVYTAWVSSKFGQVVVESPPPLSAGGGAAAAVAGSPQGVAAAARRKSVTVPTFDFVDVQLYESWSRASLAIDGPPQTPAPSYLVQLVRAYIRGWCV